MVGHLGDGNFHVLLPFNPEKKEMYKKIREFNDCLLYTSDAADEEDSVDLGGRRIIQKKNNSKPRRHKTLKCIKHVNSYSGI